jgi:hypothetical protein
LLTAAIRNQTHAPKTSDQHNPCTNAADDVAGDVVKRAIRVEIDHIESFGIPKGLIF